MLAFVRGPLSPSAEFTETERTYIAYPVCCVCAHRHYFMATFRFRRTV